MKRELISVRCLEAESGEKGQGEFALLLVKSRADLLEGFPLLGDFDGIIGKNQDLYSVGL